ncbi:LysR substrate-binding domain-containing protein [Roseateles saccharophilus]|uniref:LysR family glycine cleavage system transcriptional activator n=1 Tax=Roseateles saccharophilus TaxID=304 RepID=A0A4R3UJE6_ROSSA|nr:LysR substrate-binding domain-containing protein [Roseateles saccharophilus]MDG0834238.1 LysR family transcriptional regulator [Roseateles saccharophilus]TCU89900.1 LysR family glycine cleavage system transcriptional activator [Roseateles saccharophilus]
MNQPIRQRPLSIGPLRAFEAIARLLSFRAAAEELSLTQSAVSRQIQALEDEIGCTLFVRGTRKVELSSDGAQLLPTAIAVLSRLDQTVRQIRRSRGRSVVNVTTFASFASLWLIPRLCQFQKNFPDIDIRVSALDRIADLDDGEHDLALRYASAAELDMPAELMFEETVSPVFSPWYAESTRNGRLPPLRQPADLAAHALTEEDDPRPSASYLSWRRWLTSQGQPELEPLRWMYFNFTYQQIQAALAGQGVALARLPMVHEQLQSGELVEPFGKAGRLGSPFSYWLINGPNAARRPEVKQFADWVREQAALTRDQLAGV